MYHFVLKEIAEPLIRRAGTFVGSTALAYGLVADVAPVEGAVTLLLGLVFDLVLSHLNRKSRK